MLTVRAMESDDIAKVYAIECNIHRVPWSHDSLLDCMLIGYDGYVLEKVSTDAKQVVGYLIGRRYFNTYHILNIGIKASFQNQGFGKFLLQSLLDSLLHSIIHVIVLEVRPSNHAALALYERLGFYRDLIKKSYYNDENTKEDALLLKKIIFHP